MSQTDFESAYSDSSFWDKVKNMLRLREKPSSNPA